MTKTPQDIEAIQRQVVAMYERHPFPSITDKFRKASEEMHLKMRLLGTSEEDYRHKRILDCGCGTGEFTCWYAAQGNQVTAIDLSLPSLRRAEAYARENGLGERIEFCQKSVLELDFPDNTFDLVYSYGVLHHTADPYRGFKNMVRVCRPGGVVIVSVYSCYSRFFHRLRQKLLAVIAGEDLEKRCQWGKRLFPLTARKLKLRSHDESDAVLYDQFSQPHESLHSVAEILGWLESNNLNYLGAYGPLRIRDYLYAATLPEYRQLEVTFAGSLVSRIASRSLRTLAKFLVRKPRAEITFPHPSRLSQHLVQWTWFFLGLRFSCFSIAGRKLDHNQNCPDH